MLSDAPLRAVLPVSPTVADIMRTSENLRTTSSICASFSLPRVRLVPTGMVTLIWMKLLSVSGMNSVPTRPVSAKAPTRLIKAMTTTMPRCLMVAERNTRGCERSRTPCASKGRPYAGTTKSR